MTDSPLPASPAAQGPAPSSNEPETASTETAQDRLPVNPDAAPPSADPPETLFWRVAPYLIAAGLLIEVLYFGYRAEVQVCVGKAGAHDFSLVGQARTDANRWKFPACEQRLNLGFSHRFDEITQDARQVACRRATMIQYKSETRDCVAGRQHWELQVKASQMPPWDKRFYRALLGLD